MEAVSLYSFSDASFLMVVKRDVRISFSSLPIFFLFLSSSSFSLLPLSLSLSLSLSLIPPSHLPPSFVECLTYSCLFFPLDFLFVSLSPAMLSLLSLVPHLSLSTLYRRCWFFVASQCLPPMVSKEIHSCRGITQRR